jgi:hypothetical protein
MDPSTTLRAGRLTPHALPAIAVVVVFTILLVLTGASPARADGPGIGKPWVVSVGDSYISGEAGRWAGNTKEGVFKTDALGPRAYNDNAGRTAEVILGCHRSRSAEVYIEAAVSGENLACSGAKTSSFTSGKDFKPGIDFFHFLSHEGQALMLEKFAKTHNVKLVPLSIGGNNFDFASIVQTCVEDFLFTPEIFPLYCSKGKTAINSFKPSNVATQQAAIKGAILNVAKAMTNAGYSSPQYTILVQNYPSPIPNGSGFRYSQKGLRRQTVGGCGFWDHDANEANAKMLPTIDGAVFNATREANLPNLKTMNISSAFNGRRLCEKGVGLLEEEGLTSWSQPGAVNRTEWIDQIRTITALVGPYKIQEDLHPNYWGQLALRNCLTQAYNAGTPRGGTCTISGPGLNFKGEPNMTLK